MTELATLGLSIRSDGVVVATDRLKDFEGAGRKAEGVAGSLMRVAGAMGLALAGAFSTQVLGQYADAWSDMQSRVGAAIKNMEAAPAMMMRITDIANASYSPLQQTNDVYGRNVTTLGALGRSAVEAADFTEALNHALVTTATKGQDADVVINALSRSISNNKMRTMEFETIMSRSPRVLEAIAAEMDTNIIGLRRLAEQGKVTGAIIVDALINSLEELRDEAGRMPATLSDARMIFTNVFTEWVGRIDQAWNASGRLAEQTIELAMAFRGTADTVIRLGNIVGMVVGPAFDQLASNMDTLASVVGIAVAAVAGFYAPAMLSGLASLTWAIGTGLVGAIKAVTLAMMANPLGLLIGGLAAAVTAAFIFRDQIRQAIGIDVVDVMIDVGNKTIGVFVGAYEAIKEQWSNLPTFFSAIGKLAWNDFLSAFEGPALKIETPWGSWESGGFDLSGAKSELSGAEMASLIQGSATFDQGFNRKYIEGLGDAVGALWSNAEGAGGAISDLMNSLGGNGDGMGGLGGTGKLNAYQEATKSVLENIQALNQQALTFGLSETAATRFSTAMDLLRAAEEAKIPITGALINEINAYADATAMAAERVKTLQEQQAAAAEQMNFYRSTFVGLFTDLSGYIKQNAGEWKTFGDVVNGVWQGVAQSALNALQKIADRMIEHAATGIFDILLGAIGGALTGGLSGGGMFFSPASYVPGGFYPGLPGFARGTEFAPGGWGWVGEQGPELMRIPRGAQIMPHQQSRAFAANQNSGNDNESRGDIIVQNTIHLSGSATEEDGAALARGITRELDRQLPDAIERYNNDPYRRSMGGHRRKVG